MNTPFHLHNKTVLVTGASSGIGRQIAISCSEMGAKVVVTGRDKERLHETFSSLHGEGHSQFICNLLNEEERLKLAEDIPALDGVVHCAGIVSPTPTKYIEEKHIRQVMGSNFELPILLTGRLMRSKKINHGASFVFMSSISSHYPYNGGSLYTASKAAIESYSKNLAFENYTRGIRSNCISPAMVDTPIYQQTKEGMYGVSPEKYPSLYPLGIGKPEDVANAAIFLLSDASKWITGTNILMDGGYSLTLLVK
jgi:NAD(P)-dependent dehydrogenase (short-subunit alcohol dehydrogenase family)